MQQKITGSVSDPAPKTAGTLITNAFAVLIFLIFSMV